MWQELICRYSQRVKNEIEKGAIKKFALAIGENLPIYTDEDFAKKTPHGRIIAPPTFPRTLEYGEIKGLHLPPAGLIHGEQVYHYERPLYAGDVVYGQCQLLSVEKKQTRSGQMLFVKLKQYGFDEQNKEIFTSEKTLLLTEKLLMDARWKELG